MPEPIHYVKDSQLFPLVIEDFASRLDVRLHTMEMGFAGGHKWYLNYFPLLIKNIPHLYLTLFFAPNQSGTHKLISEYAFRCGSRPIDKTHNFFKSSVICSQNIQFCIGRPVLERILNDLENGALKIQVEIRVLAITDKDGIRKFNFHDPFKGCVKLTNQKWRRSFFVRKQSISYHCPLLAKEIKKGNSEVEVPTTNGPIQFEVFLQLLHGVPLIIDSKTFSNMIKTAHRFHVTNIFQHYPNELKKCDLSNRLLPVKCSKSLIKKIDKEALREFLREAHLEKMKTEVLKAIVRKFFSFAVDFNKCSWH